MKRVRQTSIDVYLKIKENGLLPKMQSVIFERLYNHGPMTAAECMQDLHLPSNQSGRFTELRKKGVIQEIGKRHCTVTGHKVIEWDVTDRLPARKPEASKPDKRKEAIRIIEHLSSTAMINGAQLSELDKVKQIIKEL